MSREVIASLGHQVLHALAEFPTIEEVTRTGSATVVLASGAPRKVTAERAAFCANTEHPLERTKRQPVTTGRLQSRRLFSGSSAWPAPAGGRAKPSMGRIRAYSPALCHRQRSTRQNRVLFLGLRMCAATLRESCDMNRVSHYAAVGKGLQGAQGWSLFVDVAIGVPHPIGRQRCRPLRYFPKMKGRGNVGVFT